MCPMSQQQPRPAPASTYSALNGAAPREPADNMPPDPDTARLASETERLTALKGALWASFQAEPASAERAPIVDFTMAYTDALRLELRLRAAGKQSKAESHTRRAMARAGLKGI